LLFSYDGPDDGGGDGGPVDLLDVIAADRPAAGGVRREGGIIAVVPIPEEQGSDGEVEQEDWVLHEEEEVDDDGWSVFFSPAESDSDGGGDEAAAAAVPAAVPAAAAEAAAAAPAAPPSPALPDPGGAEPAPREVRAGADGWPRLAHPTGSGYIRLSQNADGSWDMRAVCEQCGATFSRTCKAPSARAREGSKAFGQGRPLGKLWLWLSLAGEMLADHAVNDHPPRGWDPCFENRRLARLLTLDDPALALWLAKERPIDPLRDGADGEPLLIS
jgi:hypothetical protein